MLLELTLSKNSFLGYRLFCFDFNKTKEVCMILFKSSNLPPSLQIVIKHLKGAI
ncbi:MAG: hypothetical protein A4E25_01989 [Methanobacterium sp. PtaB.Bin024]|jgi:hypothetical protein|nr:MAG: hypothetical protein A4E25_01989 [Methanobacterium sp. PtaB.Bin024]